MNLLKARLRRQSVKTLVDIAELEEDIEGQNG
jgi:hypothetical protein